MRLRGIMMEGGGHDCGGGWACADDSLVDKQPAWWAGPPSPHTQPPISLLDATTPLTRECIKLKDDVLQLPPSGRPHAQPRPPSFQASAAAAVVMRSNADAALYVIQACATGRAVHATRCATPTRKNTAAASDPALAAAAVAGARGAAGVSRVPPEAITAQAAVASDPADAVTAAPVAATGAAPASAAGVAASSRLPLVASAPGWRAFAAAAAAGHAAVDKEL
jgi:hypothetical protein